MPSGLLIQPSTPKLVPVVRYNIGSRRMREERLYRSRRKAELRPRHQGRNGPLSRLPSAPKPVVLPSDMLVPVDAEPVET
jgi:hypothetical protein